MTCIVAMKHNNKIYIGGDSLGSDSTLSKTVRADNKVFLNGDMLFGFTDSFRMGQILQYVMSHPPRPRGMTDMRYLVSLWIPALIDCFDANGYRGSKGDDDHDETRSGGTFLMGYKGVLYRVESDFQIGIPSEQYDAVGCGQDLALGAMYCAKQSGIKDPDKILTMGLEAAEKFSAGVQRPFNIMSI